MRAALLLFVACFATGSLALPRPEPTVADVTGGCAAALGLADLDLPLALRKSLQHEPPYEGRSLEMVGEEEGPRGGRLLHLQRRVDRRYFDGMAPWLSNTEMAPNAPQGDPRWFIRFFGPKAARFFGFEFQPHRPWFTSRLWAALRFRSVVDESLLIAPDGYEFNQGILALNRLLPKYERIRLRTYTARGDAQVSTVRYNRRFARFAALPIAEDEGVLLHDLSFHLMSIVYPPEDVTHAQVRVSAFFDFVRFLRKRYGNFGPAGEFLLFVKNELLGTAARSIDGGTGNLGPFLLLEHSDYPRHELSAWAEISFTQAYERGYRTFVGQGRSARDILRDEVEGLIGRAKMRVSVDLMKAFEAFDAEYFSTPGYTNELPVRGITQLCERLRARRALLIEAAENALAL